MSSLDDHRTKCRRERWNSFDESSIAKMKSIAEDFDIDLATPRVRRRSVTRRSALDLLNHMQFDLTQQEEPAEKIYNEGENNDDTKQRTEEASFVSLTSSNPLSALSFSSTSIRTTQSSSFSDSIMKEREIEPRNDIRKKKKSSKSYDPNEEEKSKSNKITKNPVGSRVNRKTLGRRTQSMPLPNEIDTVKNEDPKEWIRKTEEIQGGIFQRPGFYGAEPLHVIARMGNDIQTRYEKYKEDQKIKEARKILHEAAKKREMSNLRNLLSSHNHS